ncbi:glycoside hydrolase family 3 N-terminal domain-containing protein [Pedobacter immunditicola]|uniref:glycoside hydrolase family 3 N-terminal domain-containing protein n=1 Tax=Pedobacter immunditicola TaxID=3133440 RepID=UPI0030968D84
MMKTSRRNMITIILLVFSNTLSLSAQKKMPYKNPDLPVAERVGDLLARMTVEEKAGQLSVLLGWEMYEKNKGVSVSEKFKSAVKDQYIGMLWATLRADPWTKKTLINGLDPFLASQATNAIQKWNIEHSRLQIPIFIAEECPHGHMAIGTTVFPTAIGQASTWAPDLIQEMAEVIAKEARLQGAHIGYGPVLDLARELRWSRVEETYGEDPYLTGAMGVAMVKGFQGNDFQRGRNIISTLKHFAAYGIPEGGHNGGFVNLGPRALLQDYLPPFKAAVKAGAGSVMTAYNSIDGIPCSANPFLLKTVLREQWGFKGFTISDLHSIGGLTGNDHVAAGSTDAAAQAINAGLDSDLGGSVYSFPLLEAVKSGKVTMARLDEAVGRILTKKFEMGLFENPYTKPELAKKGVRDQQAIDLNRSIARASAVLLKNEGQLLPLSKTIGSIAIIGPNADNIYNQLGDYTAPQHPNDVVTVLDGIRNKLSNKTIIRYVKGCAIRDTSTKQIEAAVHAAEASDVTVVVLGGSSARDFKTEYLETGAANINHGAISDMESGEGFDRSSLDLLGKQLELLQALSKTRKPVVLVMIQGRPLNINWAAAHIPAILNMWYPGQQGGHAVADVIFGDYNPAGRLPVSIPRSVGQLPVYYSYQNASRHDYVEGPSTPLYGFGFGLSYTNFSYADLQVSKSSVGDSLTVDVSFTVRNTGEMDGDEVAQLYISDQVSSVVVPNKQLKAFKRFHLKKGAQKKITLQLNAEDFSLFDANYRNIAEEGSFKIAVGSSAADIKLSGNLVLERSYQIR